ncbi:RHS repeat-associated core domain-containing protein [Marinobacter sp.]|uniref:RHS repeat-associated core domain-containing protein n=1 Tax=Marinobacter sp. TaxID=50741 RepID=UPI0034A58517
MQEAHSGRTTSYTYDELYRLTGETITDPVNGDYSAEYKFDKVGNRTYSIINGVHTAYSYDNNDRLTQQGGVSYSYDANGNTLTETEDGQVTRYHYDGRNQLIEVEKPGLTASYGYNADGIRTRKTENGQATNYVVDSNRDYAQVLAEVTNGTTEVSYTYGDDLVSQTRAGNPSYYLYDGHGSTRALANASGSLTDSYDYDAFGVLLASSGDTENAYRYTGEQLDPSMDQYYLRARYYDQGAGRFTQMDTWMGNGQDPVTLHKYLYANADPANFTDPTGNFSLGNLSIGMNATVQLGGRAVGSSALRMFVNRAITTTIKQSGKLASHALKSVRACIRKKNKCGLRANLLIVGQDNPHMADHIRDAQMPHTIVLKYDKVKAGNRKWYKTKPECRIPKAGYQCDEYPFFKTREGGPRGYPVSVSLRQVPAIENMSVGGHFGFLSSRMRSGEEFIVVADRNIPLTVALPLGGKKK